TLKGGCSDSPVAGLTAWNVSWVETSSPPMKNRPDRGMGFSKGAIALDRITQTLLHHPAPPGASAIFVRRLVRSRYQGSSRGRTVHRLCRRRPNAIMTNLQRRGVRKVAVNCYTNEGTLTQQQRGGGSNACKHPI